MVRVFANGPGGLGSLPGRVIPKTQKIVTWCCGLGSNGNEGGLPHSPNLKVGASLSDSLMSYPDHSLGVGLTLLSRMSEYFTASEDNVW